MLRKAFVGMSGDYNRFESPSLEFLRGPVGLDVILSGDLELDQIDVRVAYNLLQYPTPACGKGIAAQFQADFRIVGWIVS
jgi:hypothetical protein